MSPKKKFLSTTAGKIAFSAGGLVFSALFLLLTTDIRLAGLFPSETTLDNARRECKQAEADLALAEQRLANFTDVEARFRKLRESSWVESRDGAPDVELRKRIEGAARKAGLDLTSIGAVRRSRINNDLSFLELEVNAASTLELLSAFWLELSGVTPRLSWKRVDLRPELAQNSDRIFFSGTLRLIGRETAGTETAAAPRNNADGGTQP